MSSLANAALGDVLVEARPGFACGDALQMVSSSFASNITTEGQDLSKKRRVKIDRYLVESGDVLFNATKPPCGKDRVLSRYFEEPRRL